MLICDKCKSVNITNQVASIEIFEDIFSPFRTANIVMKDSIDYVITN
jgi:hypothetical protein